MYFKKDYVKKLILSIQTIKKSVIIVFVVSIYQIISYKFDLPFDKIFRMNPSSNFQPHGNFIRVSGPTIEPSMIAIFLLFSLGIVFLKKEKTI